MTSDNITFQINGNSFDIDGKRVLGHIALALGVLIIFGFWGLVICTLFSTGFTLLAEDTDEKAKNADVSEEFDNL